MIYELWDADGGNCIGMHRTEASALRAVAALIRRHGRDSREVRSLGLLVQDADGDGRLIAEGPVLADRAVAVASSHVRVSAKPE